MKKFTSKYPIICAPMNQVSDLNLALAVSKAGAIPSLISYCYADKYEFFNEVELFLKETDNSDIIVAIDDKDIIHPHTIKKIKELNIKYLMRYPNENKKFTEGQLHSIYNNATSILKNISCDVIELYIKSGGEVLDNNFYFLKGSDGAGRGLVNTEQLFSEYKNKYPNGSFIPVGGIGSPKDVKKYIDAGATAIAVGTLFAASAESKLSLESKQRIVRATSKDLKRFSVGQDQQAIFFEKFNQTDDDNHTESLKEGIATGTSGHLFAGKGIDHVDSIKPVVEIVKYLVSTL